MVSAPDVRTPGDEFHSFPDLVVFLAPFVLFALIIVLFGLSRMRIGYFYAKKNAVSHVTVVFSVKGRRFKWGAGRLTRADMKNGREAQHRLR